MGLGCLLGRAQPQSPSCGASTGGLLWPLGSGLTSPAPGSGVGVSCCRLGSLGAGLGRDGTGLSPYSTVVLVLLDGRADMEFLEVLTEHLDRVLLVRGGGREVITIYS